MLILTKCVLKLFVFIVIIVRKHNERQKFALIILCLKLTLENYKLVQQLFYLISIDLCRKEKTMIVLCTLNCQR